MESIVRTLSFTFISFNIKGIAIISLDIQPPIKKYRLALTQTPNTFCGGRNTALLCLILAYLSEKQEYKEIFIRRM